MFRRKAVKPVEDRWLVVGLGNPGPEYEAATRLKGKGVDVALLTPG